MSELDALRDLRALVLRTEMLRGIKCKHLTREEWDEVVRAATKAQALFGQFTLEER